MKGQAQEQSGRKQRIDGKGSRPTPPSVRNQAPPLEVEVMDQSDAMPDTGNTRVAELAYGLYEQRGRGDGHDWEDWFNAEQQLMT